MLLGPLPWRFVHLDKSYNYNTDLELNIKHHENTTVTSCRESTRIISMIAKNSLTKTVNLSQILELVLDENNTQVLLNL